MMILDGKRIRALRYQFSVVKTTVVAKIVLYFQARIEKIAYQINERGYPFTRWNTMFSDAQSKIPRLLIIEKDGSLKEQFTVSLSNEYEFYTASSIDESLQIIKERGIHGILLDISSLGREDGFLGTRRIKATNSNGKLPVIALLPDADPTMKTDSLLAGCTTFIIKPVDVLALDAVITEVLNLTAAYRPQSAGA